MGLVDKNYPIFFYRNLPKSATGRAFDEVVTPSDYMLNATTTAYKETAKGLSKAAMDKLLPGLKKEYEWLGQAYCQVLQRVTFNQ